MKLKKPFLLRNCRRGNSFVFYPNESFEKIVENLNAVNELEHNKNPANVKEDIKALRKLPEFVFKELSLTRNLTPSNSHASVYKKYDMLTQITDEAVKTEHSKIV
ncbi:hypothetical protein EHP00_2423 [Ecytonucleospora hepatopenaei]|uniref:Uncharacterized protein n=1 Tax=Ecytonucleospora hepatopenaei TaxID=646526 RepID=A0A1W0E909_9MICR|nr:hypothetical protein EHP00_2423 [Ecytonucleospora hepatopenaei]